MDNRYSFDDFLKRCEGLGVGKMLTFAEEEYNRWKGVEEKSKDFAYLQRKYLDNLNKLCYYILNYGSKPAGVSEDVFEKIKTVVKYP